MLKAVIFDLGDTLLKQNLKKLKTKKFDAFKKFGYNIPKDDLKVAFEETKKDFHKKYFGSPKRHRDRYRLELVLKNLGYKPDKSKLLKMEKFIKNHWLQLAKLYPGAKKYPISL